MIKRTAAAKHDFMAMPSHPAGVDMVNGPNALKVQPIKDIAGLAGAFISSLSRSTGLSRLETQQQLLLLSLYSGGEMSQAELPKHTGCQRSAVSRNIARLGDGEKPLLERGPGWITTREDLNDRRNNYVSLTPLGRAVIDKAIKEVQPMFLGFAQRQAQFLVGSLMKSGPEMTTDLGTTLGPDMKVGPL